MSYLIDTNVISEIRKGARCDIHVSTWFASIADEDIFLSVLVLGEIRKGIERARPRDPGKAAALERWLQDMKAAFKGRVLEIDDAVPDQWGRMSAIRPVAAIDGLLAATALTHDLTLDAQSGVREQSRDGRAIRKDGASIYAQYVAPINSEKAYGAAISGGNSSKQHLGPMRA